MATYKKYAVSGDGLNPIKSFYEFVDAREYAEAMTKIHGVTFFIHEMDKTGIIPPDDEPVFHTFTK